MGIAAGGNAGAGIRGGTRTPASRRAGCGPTSPVLREAPLGKPGAPTLLEPRVAGSVSPACTRAGRGASFDGGPRTEDRAQMG